MSSLKVGDYSPTRDRANPEVPAGLLKSVWSGWDGLDKLVHVFRNPAALGAIVLSKSALFAYLADARGPQQFAKVFFASAGLLLTLMGLGAVFGKTLGDFLRNVNG